MKVIVTGAGKVGYVIASLLSNEHHDVTLVDRDTQALQRAAQELDVATQLGSGTDWKLLEELIESGPELLLALTGDDETNLATCEIAKGLGIHQTVARVRQWSFLNQTRLDFGRLFAVDHFISPKLLVALEIEKYLLNLGSIQVESYAHGAVQMRTFLVPERWKWAGRSLSKLTLPEGTMAGLIYRKEKEEKKGDRSQVIFPHGDDVFHPGDEVSLVGTAAPMQHIHTYFGISQKRLTSAIILGGGPVGFLVARDLSEQGVRVRLIEASRERCAYLSEQLHRVTVMHHDATDLPFLESERIDLADVVICATGEDDRNAVIALLAKQMDCNQIVVEIENPAIAAMLREKGIAHLVSPSATTANRMMAIARAQQVIASSSLYDNRVKVMEIKVSYDSKIVGIPLAQLGPYLPKEFLFAVIQNRGRIMIAKGDRILCPGDTAIVITSPKQTDKVLQLF